MFSKIMRFHHQNSPIFFGKVTKLFFEGKILWDSISFKKKFWLLYLSQNIHPQKLTIRGKNNFFIYRKTPMFSHETP